MTTSYSACWCVLTEISNFKFKHWSIYKIVTRVCLHEKLLLLWRFDRTQDFSKSVMFLWLRAVLRSKPLGDMPWFKRFPRRDPSKTAHLSSRFRTHGNYPVVVRVSAANTTPSLYSTAMIVVWKEIPLKEPDYINLAKMRYTPVILRIACFQKLHFC